MRYEKIQNPSGLFSRASRHTRLTEDIMELHADNSFEVVKVIGAKEHYSSLSSAQSSYNQCIKRLKVNLKAYIVDGELYIARIRIGNTCENNNVSYETEG